MKHTSASSFLHNPDPTQSRNRTIDEDFHGIHPVALALIGIAGREAEKSRFYWSYVMLTKTRIILLAGAATAALVAWSTTDQFGKVSAQHATPPGQAKQGHQKGHFHNDMFLTTNDPRRAPIDDPQINLRTIEYTPLAPVSIADAQNGDQPAIAGGLENEVYVLIQGDMIIATEQELFAAAAARSGALSQIALNEPPPEAAAAPPMAPMQREALEQIKGAAPPNTQATRKALAAGALSEAAILGSRVDAAKQPYLRKFGEATRKIREDERKNRPQTRSLPQASLPQAAPVPRNVPQDQIGFKLAPPVPNSTPSSGPNQVQFSVATTGRTWNHQRGVIPWQFHSTFPQAQRQSVLEAIKHWHERTNRIHFLGRTVANAAQYQNFIVFVPAPGCAARVGPSPTPGPQAVQLASGCGVPQVIHELGHVVGLWHEMTRNQRDFDIRINFQNVDRNMAFNFQEIGTAGQNIGPFDWDSIMLYPRLAFSSNGQPSMIRPNSTDQNFGIDTGAAGGRTRVLSDGDLAGVEFLYRTPANPPNPAHAN